MNYVFETRRYNMPGRWLNIGTNRCDLTMARMVAQDIATELQREIRVVTYGGKTGFQVHAEFSATGQSLRMESE